MRTKPRFKAYILKRRTVYGKGWFCYTHERPGYGLTFDRYRQYGPFSKRDAKMVKESAKKDYAARRLA